MSSLSQRSNGTLNKKGPWIPQGPLKLQPFL
jgi:hypothetical protein